MFRIKIEQDLELELMNTFRTKEVYDVAIKNKEDLQKWLLWIDRATIESMDEFYEKMLNYYSKKRAIGCFIIYKDKFIGVAEIGIKQGYGLNYGEIGYWLDFDYAKKGIMTKSVTKIIELGFEHLDITKAVIRCADKNQDSSNMAKRLGFKKDATIRADLKVKGVLYNMEVWSLLREEWQNRD